MAVVGRIPPWPSQVFFGYEKLCLRLVFLTGITPALAIRKPTVHVILVSNRVEFMLAGTAEHDRLTSFSQVCNVDTVWLSYVPTRVLNTTDVILAFRPKLVKSPGVLPKLGLHRTVHAGKDSSDPGCAH